MKNCLIINGADFSANAIERVTIIDGWVYNFTNEQWEAAAEQTLNETKTWNIDTTMLYGFRVVAVRFPSTVTGTVIINETTYSVSIGMNTIQLNNPVTLSPESTISFKVSDSHISGCNANNIGPRAAIGSQYSIAIDFCVG